MKRRSGLVVDQLAPSDNCESSCTSTPLSSQLAGWVVPLALARVMASGRLHAAHTGILVLMYLLHRCLERVLPRQVLASVHMRRIGDPAQWDSMCRYERTSGSVCSCIGLSYLCMAEYSDRSEERRVGKEWRCRRSR